MIIMNSRSYRQKIFYTRQSIVDFLFILCNPHLPTSRSNFETQKQITYNYLFDFLEKHLRNNPEFMYILSKLDELNLYSSFLHRCYIIEMLKEIEKAMDKWLTRNNIDE